MRVASLLSFGWLVLSVSAYGSVGAYERMWYWYAYVLDGEVGSGNKIAEGCGKANSVGRCSFSQFIQYITTPAQGLDSSKLQGVDTTDLDASVKALIAGGYTGTYQTNLIAKVKPNAFPQIFQAVGGFCAGNVGDSSDATLKTNLQQSTLSVLQGRQLNNVQAFTSQMQGLGWTVVTNEIEVFDGSTDTMTEIDVQGTAAASGVSEEEVEARMTVMEESDTTNHQVNIVAAQTAAQGVSEGCL